MPSIRKGYTRQSRHLLFSISFTFSNSVLFLIIVFWELVFDITTVFAVINFMSITVNRHGLYRLLFESWTSPCPKIIQPPVKTIICHINVRFFCRMSDLSLPRNPLTKLFQRKNALNSRFVIADVSPGSAWAHIWHLHGQSNREFGGRRHILQTPSREQVTSF